MCQKCAIHNTFYAKTLPCIYLEHVIKKRVLVSGQFGRYDKHRQAAAITIFEFYAVLRSAMAGKTVPP